MPETSGVHRASNAQTWAPVQHENTHTQRMGAQWSGCKSKSDETDVSTPWAGQSHCTEARSPHFTDTQRRGTKGAPPIRLPLTGLPGLRSQADTGANVRNTGDLGHQRRPETGLGSRQGPGGGHTGPKRPPSEAGGPRHGTAGTRWLRGGRLSPFFPTISIRLTQTKRQRQPDPPKDFFKQTLLRPGQPAPRWLRSETPQAVWEAGLGGGRSAAGAGPTATPGARTRKWRRTDCPHVP